MILQLYIFRQIAVAFAFAVGGMVFIAVPGIAVAAVHRLAGVETEAIVAFVPLLLLGLVPYILPLGFLLAVVVTYGRLAADNEWTAIRMAGIHPLWMVAPAFVLAAACSLATRWLVAEVLPLVRMNQKVYELDALRSTVRNLSPGRTDLHFDLFYLQSEYREGNDFIDVLISIPHGKESQTIKAERVAISIEGDTVLIRMRGARVVHGPVDLQVENPTVRLDLDQLVERSQRGHRSLRYQSSSEIRSALAAGGLERADARLMEFEIQYRLALATTFFMFLALGVPTGLLLRRGTQLGALSVAVGYALLYYVLTLRLGKELARFEVLPPAISAWTVNATGTLAGLVLLWRALRQ